MILYSSPVIEEMDGETGKLHVRLWCVDQISLVDFCEPHEEELAH